MFITRECCSDVMAISVEVDPQLPTTILLTVKDTWNWEDVYNALAQTVQLAQDHQRLASLILLPERATVLPPTSLIENTRTIIQQLDTPRYIGLTVYVLRDPALIALIKAVNDRLRLLPETFAFARTLEEARGLVAHYHQNA